MSQKGYLVFQVSPSPGAFLAGRGIWIEKKGIRWTFGETKQGIGQQAGVMQSDANPDSGAGVGSRGGTVRNAIGNGAGGSGNPRRSKRQRKEEDDQGTAGEDSGMHMACMVYIVSCAGISTVVLLQPWDPVMVTSGTDWKYCFGGRRVCRENQQGN